MYKLREKPERNLQRAGTKVQKEKSLVQSFNVTLNICKTNLNEFFKCLLINGNLKVQNIQVL